MVQINKGVTAIKLTKEQLADKLDQLHNDLIEEVRVRIKSHTASSADLVLAWKILSDNGVQLANLRNEVGGKEKADEGFLGSLPFPRQAAEA